MEAVREARMSVRSWRLPWPVFLTLVWGGLVALGLALRPVLPVDETRYLSVAWEMWVRGDFLVPHLNGAPYSHKPPLLFWLFQAGWAAFGVNEWWPRLVPSLFALANLFLTAALARRLWPERPAVARLAPIILLGFLLWSVFTTFVMFDMLVATAVLVALLGLHTARERGGALPWLQAGAGLGLGILAKGPVVLLPVLAVALLAPWWSRGRSRGGAEAPSPAQRGRVGEGAAGWRWAAGVLAAVAIGAAVALAWALPAALSGGEAYADAIFLGQTEGRLVDSFAHNRPWWWYLALLPAVLFPYSVWPPLLQALGRAARRQLGRGMPTDPGVRFCLAWAVPVLAVFSLISGKQLHYLIPLLPALALLAARLLDSPAPATRRWHLVPPVSLLLGVGALMAFAPEIVGRWDVPSWAGFVSPGVGVFTLLAGVAFLAAFERLPARRTLPTWIGLVLVLAAHLGFSEAGNRAYDVEPIARYLSVLERQGRPIAFVGTYHGEFHFLGRLERPFEEILPGGELLWLRDHPDGRVVQDFHHRSPDLRRAEFVQPYRGEEALAVLGEAYLHSWVPSG
jgi:4-amino-4-deoxy-L-arabinose transferase-like glycosyltransferase